MFTTQESTCTRKFSSKFLEGSLIPKWLKPVWICWEGASLPSREGESRVGGTLKREGCKQLIKYY